jgi:hypothetical protein
MGGGPEGVVLLEPFFDGLVQTNVAVEGFRTEEFVPEDFFLLEKAFVRDTGFSSA